MTSFKLPPIAPAIPAVAFALASLCWLVPAFAHITLERGQAPVGFSYKATLRVPHGCAGAATNAVKVRIPDGFIGVKPMPKAGWTLATKKEAYGRSYEVNHAQVSEGVREISWSGGTLGDDEYDEFTFVGTIASDLKPDSVLYFPTVQECGSKAERWIEIPTAGASARDLKLPAPRLQLVPAAASAH